MCRRSADRAVRTLEVLLLDELGASVALRGSVAFDPRDYGPEKLGELVRAGSCVDVNEVLGPTRVSHLWVRRSNRLAGRRDPDNRSRIGGEGDERWHVLRRGFGGLRGDGANSGSGRRGR
jgi:hypothetical protein